MGISKPGSLLILNSESGNQVGPDPMCHLAPGWSSHQVESMTLEWAHMFRSQFDMDLGLERWV